MSAQQALDKVLRAAGKVHVMLEPSQVTRLAMAEFVLAASDLADAVHELDRRVRKGEMPASWAEARAEVKSRDTEITKGERTTP